MEYFDNGGNQPRAYSRWNNQADCEENDGDWMEFYNFLEKADGELHVWDWVFDKYCTSFLLYLGHWFKIAMIVIVNLHGHDEVTYSIFLGGFSEKVTFCLSFCLFPEEKGSTRDIWKDTENNVKDIPKIFPQTNILNPSFYLKIIVTM